MGMLGFASFGSIHAVVNARRYRRVPPHCPRLWWACIARGGWML